jgi:hypothetical protein
MYLGILFSFNGTFLQTQEKLSDQGRKAVFGLFNKIQDDSAISKNYNFSF